MKEINDRILWNFFWIYPSIEWIQVRFKTSV